MLYPVGMLCAYMCYWTDKYLFVRLYQKPPLYDDLMAAQAIKLIKFALFIHCFASLYMYSNDEILSYVRQNDYLR